MTHDSEGTRAQSEVIGVVLLVGIVVLLAGLAGMFIFDMTSNDIEKAPQTKFDVDQYGDNKTQVRLYHAGGDVISDTDAITVTVDGTNELEEHNVSFANADGKIDSQTDVFFSKNASGEVFASESTLDDTYTGLDPGTTIRIVWNPEDADNSAILFEYEVESRD